MSSKRHHFVPQFYLRRFADGEGKLRIYRSGTALEPIRSSVKDAAVRTGFYKIDMDGPGDPMQLEAELSRIEGDAAGAIARICAGGFPPTDFDRGVLSVFMALQLTRTPEHRLVMEKQVDTLEKVFYENMTPEWARQRLTEIGLDPTEESVAAIMDIAENPDQYVFSPDRNEFLQMMMGVALQIAPILEARAWRLGISPGPGIVAGDHAPVRFTLPEARRPFLGIGLRDAQEVDFPLDRYHALVTFKAGPEETFVLTRENVIFINSLVAETSHDFVFQHPDDPRIDYMVPKSRRPLMLVNQQPVYAADKKIRRLAPIFAPHSVRSGSPFDDEPPKT